VAYVWVTQQGQLTLASLCVGNDIELAVLKNEVISLLAQTAQSRPKFIGHFRVR
jgi:hypothetical protein